MKDIDIGLDNWTLFVPRAIFNVHDRVIGAQMSNKLAFSWFVFI